MLPYSAEVADESESGMRWQGQLDLSDDEEEECKDVILWFYGTA